MRRRLAATLALALVMAASAGSARTFVDGAGRSVEVPERIRKVMAAGPPASVAIYALAPELMAGWVTELRPAERAFIAPAFVDLTPTTRSGGRIGPCYCLAAGLTPSSRPAISSCCTGYRWR